MHTTPRVTSSDIHYTRLSVYQFQQAKKSRYHVNQSISFVHCPGKFFKVTWKFTDQLCEFGNSVKGTACEDSESYKSVRFLWKELRKQHKNSVKLWVAKGLKSKDYVKGRKLTPNERYPEHFSLLVYHKDNDVLLQHVFIEDFYEKIRFEPVDKKDFNMVADWRNPESKLISTTKLATPGYFSATPLLGGTV